MRTLDWIVLVSTLVFIVVYGIWKTRGNRDMQGYLLANKSMPWYVVGLSIMATQASAITFLSAPGLGYSGNMRFVQFYLGLPLAMVVLCIFFVPLYHRLNVYTAYEYLESRFDLKTRGLAAALFLLSRGLAAGLTIYAPSLILSTILDWNVTWTNLVIGGLVIVYTVSGGTAAVSQTQKQQMAVILVGLVVAFGVMVSMLPEELSFGEAMHVAGKMGRLQAFDPSFDLNDRYTLWSGLIGGFFLFMSYFGTDQSQVGRYLSGRSVGQSRLGLLFNGILKIPMQFCILFIGSILFVFYLYERPPVFFNEVETQRLAESPLADQYQVLEQEHNRLFTERQQHVDALVQALRSEDEARIDAATEAAQASVADMDAVRDRVIELMTQNDSQADTNDTNYIFLAFVTRYLPAGLVGLLIAVIFSASMSSTSSELNALASTTIVDLYRRIWRPGRSDDHYLQASKVITVLWGGYAILVAMYASQLGNLLEAVNELGSLFYGAVLGIFAVAFFLRSVQGGQVFYAALLAEGVVLLCYKFTEIGFLWYNVIGCLLVVVLTLVLDMFNKSAIKSRSK
ncbi:transporter, SSS family [Catalinimonas alkaloidigena]|uniref:Transporter, SSS family n=1 Tax=Catalinimonas alkaloidigena TaxID=1075417 RepID=A0A1G8XCF9_9BACT|nr:sodium:solute symporter [Catalinimonas alkaloidigena]SDJ88183.1 transporter, SSS family [Catalinimonas alkaloidigena]